MTDEEWESVCNNKKTFSFEYGDDLFVFMSYRKGGNFTTPFSEETMTFLSSELSSHPDSRAFVFFHFPLNSELSTIQYAGGADFDANPRLPDANRRNQGYYCHGFTLDFIDGHPYNIQNEQIIAMLSSHAAPTFALHGHTHYALSTDSQWTNVLFT